MRVLLDTSVLIAADPPPEVEAAISVASMAELHFGVLVAGDDRILGRKPRHLWRGEPIWCVAGRSPAVKEVGLVRRCIA